MNKAARTRRWSFSLRSIFVAVAVVSVLCAWLLHYRRQQVLERDRLRAMFQARDSYVNFRNVLLGWELPAESTWLARIAFPEADCVGLRAAEDTPLPEAFCEIARRCRKVEYEGHAGGDDEFLRRCTSASTEEIKVNRNGVSGDCLAFVGDCPKLRKVCVHFVALGPKSLEALLNHPGVEELDISATADDLSEVKALDAPNALQRLTIFFEMDFSRHKKAFAAAFAREPGGAPFKDPREQPASGDFTWLRQCPQLREITVTMRPDVSFIRAVGRHLQGVERLKLWSDGAELVDSLAAWRRLRWLVLDGGQMTDSRLSQIVRSCPNRHTLEVDDPGSSVALSPHGLRSLGGLADLRRLRLGYCNLTVEHMESLASVTQLEELSLEDDGVDDATLAPLRELPKLKRISLGRTRASKAIFADRRGDWDDNRPWRGTVSVTTTDASSGVD